MCGIAGELTFDGRLPSLPAVSRMTAVMSDRGPDGEGHWSNRWVRVGHRRLSVIDLSNAGIQPMSEEAHHLTVVFNGCIYNHRELRKQLTEMYLFTSDSDTEVILAAYARWGENFVDHLIGMFAIVIVDELRDVVVFARDRLGIKPLYISRTKNRLRFASTMPSLLAGGDLDTALDPVGLHHYLSWHSIVPAPRTILRGVKKLPPATVAVVDREGNWRERVYWNPEYKRDDHKRAWTYADWREAIHDSLRTSVKRRLIADVPLGILLSGGVDSSLIVGLLTELGETAIPTFSIGFELAGGQAGDEFEFSDLVASAFHTDHHRIRCTSDDVVNSIEDTMTAMTEPMSTQDVPAFYLLAGQVSDHVTVALSGQGADEVFGGYRYHQPAAHAPHMLAPELFDAAFRDCSHDVLVHLVKEGSISSWDASTELAASHLLKDGAETAFDAVLRMDTHLLMPDDPVKRVDSMTMAWGLETRVPFLDHQLVELVASCPPEYKAAQGGKGILKDIARQVVPRGVVDRPKGYFPVPSLVQLEGKALTLARDAMTSDASRSRGLFRPKVVEHLVGHPNEHFTNVGGNVLWNMATLEMWLQTHGIGDKSTPRQRSPVQCFCRRAAGKAPPHGPADLVHMVRDNPVSLRQPSLGVLNSELVAVPAHNVTRFAELGPRHAGKKVMLDLEVQAAHYGRDEKTPANVPRGQHLLTEKIDAGVSRQNRHADVVRNECRRSADPEYNHLNTDERECLRNVHLHEDKT